MRKSYLILFIVFILLFGSGCQTAQITKAGNLVIDGSISKGITTYNSPYFYGHIKNMGNNTIYNASITFTIYTDATKKTIKGTGWDYLADGNDISPDIRVQFEAVFFGFLSTESISVYDIEFDWLER